MIGLGLGNFQAGAQDAPPSFSFGNALQFDGVDDYVNISDSSAISLTEITFNAWLNLEDWGASGQEFISRFSGSATNGHFKIGNSSTRLLQPYFPTSSGAVAYLLYDASALTGWHMITVTFRQSELYLYIDGVVVASSLADTGTFLSTGVDFRIGARLNDTFYLNGIMDEVALWDTILTSEKISNLYNNGNGNLADANVTPLVWFRMNESGTATTAVNSGSSGATYDGTLTNFPTSGMWVAH